MRWVANRGHTEASGEWSEDYPSDWREGKTDTQDRWEAVLEDLDIVKTDLLGEELSTRNTIYHLPEEEPVLSHGDLCLPNIFFNDGKISCLIDLGNAGVSDKWQDLSLCYRSLKHNANGSYGKVYPGIKEDDLFSLLGIEPDPVKLRYYILLDELF